MCSGGIVREGSDACERTPGWAEEQQYSEALAEPNPWRARDASRFKRNSPAALPERQRRADHGTHVGLLVVVNPLGPGAVTSPIRQTTLQIIWTSGRCRWAQREPQWCRSPLLVDQSQSPLQILSADPLAPFDEIAVQAAGVDESDTDGDGVADSGDNCVLMANLEQRRLKVDGPANA